MKRMLTFIALLLALSLQADSRTFTIGVVGGGDPPAAGGGLTIETTASGTTASSTTHSVTLPSSIAANDIIMLFFSQLDDNSDTTWPGGYTELADDGCLFTDQLSVAYRRATGGESGSISVTTGTTTTGAFTTYRISGAHTSSAPEVNSVATGESTAPDPGSITASWGSADNLFIAAWNNQGTSTTGYPSSYTEDQLTQTGIGTAGRFLTGATDDPGTATLALTHVWCAYTTVIRPQ